MTGRTVDSTRIDRWLWSVRLCKTRADATAACRGGHVRVNRRPAKAATLVRVGDRVEARVGGRDRVVDVTRIIDKRVGAPIAAECYVDHSPAPPRRDHMPVPRRDPGSGRPTKRERRQLERWRRRNR
jgi:ribosome-associated heat shock protein Hsp15